MAERMPEPGYNEEIRAAIVKVTEHWVVGIIPMVFNDRIFISTHDEWKTGWTAAWCYDKGGEALWAAVVFDPETEREPAGYKKVAADARAGSLL